MPLQNRYFLRLKRPAPEDFLDVAVNLRELERTYNLLPVPYPQTFNLAGGNLTFAGGLLESFTFAIGHPNTRLAVDLWIDINRTAAGGGLASTFGFIDGNPIDSSLGARMHEDAHRASVATGYTVTLAVPGTHTLELHGNKSINAGTFTYDGAIRLWVL